MKNLTNEQATHGSSYKTANLLSDLDDNFEELDSGKAPINNPTFTGTVTVPTPTSASAAVNKAYVDAIGALGIIWVEPVEDIVSSLPSPGTLGTRYIRSTDNKILTNTGPDAWSETEPVEGTTLYVKSDDSVPSNEVGHYHFNGTTWVYIGASSNHNDLSSIQGGSSSERYHLSLAQHIIATQQASDIQDGYLTSVDWQTFNNKAPTNNPTFTGTVTVPNGSFTYAKIQNVSANDRILGRQSGGAGIIEEIICTAAGRALLDDATAAEQRVTIGLGNVTNESKATMFNNPTFTGTVSGITKSMVGLGNCDNTSDLNKPISTATQAALNLKANLASPAFTGTPTAPTATPGTNTTQIATTAFVQAAISTGGQYHYYTDGVDAFRQGVRGGYFVLDQTITETGFAGTMGVDWDNIRAEKLS